LRERSNIPLLPSDRTQVECRHADVRARHPEAAFDRAFTLGRALTRDDAIRTALACMNPSLALYGFDARIGDFLKLA